MKGVTIGLGEEKYTEYAKRSAQQFNKHTGLDVIILGENELQAVKHDLRDEHFFSAKEYACYLKYYVFDLFPDLQDIVYFDSDWCCIADWYPEEFAGRTEFVAVRDRVWHLQDDPKCWKKIQTHSDPWSYFNAGFYIINRKNHYELLRFARKAYYMIDRKFTDQCSTNHVIHKLGYPIFFLDRRYNWMNPGPIHTKFDIKAIHSSWTYGFYDRKEAPAVLRVILWDARKMRSVAGYYKFYVGEAIRYGHLYYDGSTNTDFLWCMDDQGQFHFFDYFSKGFIYFDRVVRVG